MKDQKAENETLYETVEKQSWMVRIFRKFDTI